MCNLYTYLIQYNTTWYVFGDWLETFVSVLPNMSFGYRLVALIMVNIESCVFDIIHWSYLSNIKKLDIIYLFCWQNLENFMINYYFGFYVFRQLIKWKEKQYKKLSHWSLVHCKSVEACLDVTSGPALVLCDFHSGFLPPEWVWHLFHLLVNSCLDMSLTCYMVDLGHLI